MVLAIRSLLKKRISIFEKFILVASIKKPGSAANDEGKKVQMVLAIRSLLNAGLDIDASDYVRRHTTAMSLRLVRGCQAW